MQHSGNATRYNSLSQHLANRRHCSLLPRPKPCRDSCHWKIKRKDHTLVSPRAAADAGAFAGEDFYSLLGLTPKATTAEVRAAYRSMMRELHPDLLTQAGNDVQEQANTLAALINQIYQTLMDPDARAMYDLLAGFADSPTAINPFLDTSFQRDQVFVDEVTCIGCGKCVRACPATFEIEASKYGRARVISQTADTPEDIEIAFEVCPVSCIYWVSLPQLSLLEAALAITPRVEVFVLQRSGGRPTANVFEVAYKSFERRRLQASEKAKAAAEGSNQRIKVDWSFWTQREDTQGQETSNPRTQGSAEASTQHKVAGLAAAAARAVRLWQSQGKAVRIRAHLSATSTAAANP